MSPIVIIGTDAQDIRTILTSPSNDNAHLASARRIARSAGDKGADNEIIDAFRMDWHDALHSDVPEGEEENDEEWTVESIRMHQKQPERKSIPQGVPIVRFIRQTSWMRLDCFLSMTNVTSIRISPLSSPAPA